MTVSEEEKRLIVVLIATNKILTPLLRDLVPKGIEKLRSFLDNYLQNISTPCDLQTLTYSICHTDPLLKGLSFQNINNNHEIKTRKKGKGKKKRKEIQYDYSIKSLVDLAKLYLPSSNAKYVAFGDSMDLSAALNLLGNNKYPTQVFVSSNPSLDIKSLANEFRITVRNPGAHFIEKPWTEHFMNQCFEKLEGLVKALVPANQEKETLDQLHLWKTKGWELIITEDLSYLMKTSSQNQDANVPSPKHTKQLLFILETLLAPFDDMETRVYSAEKCLDSTEKHKDNLHRVLTEAFENKKKKIQAANEFSEEASHMNEESGDETCEGSTSSGISKNPIDSSGGRKRSKGHKNEGRKRFKAQKNEEDLPENQLHLERINPDIVLFKYQNEAPFKIEFTGKLPGEMESGVADFENLEKGVSLVKMDDKTLSGRALPQSLKPGAFKVTVHSEDRRRCLGETTIVYIDLVEEVLEQVISCPKASLKFIKAIIARQNVHSEGGTSDGENHTNEGPSGLEKSSLSVQLLQRFIYAAAKVNAVWFIRLIFDLPAGRIVFDSYKGRPLLPEYVARARGHNEIAEYLEDVTKRYSGSEITDEERCSAINWQEIVTAIEATQESPNSSTEGVFKETVSSHNQEKCLEETKVVYTDLIDETLKQAVICPKTTLQFLQVAIPCLNVHSEEGTSDAENHTNDGPSGREKSSFLVQLLIRFIYEAAKVNAVWFIRLIFDLPAGRIVFDSYKGRPLLPEYVARARGHNEIAEYLEDVTKRYSESERTDEKFNAINWQEIVTAILATQENLNSFSEIIKTGKNTDGNEARCDDWMSNASSQQVRGKEPRSNFSDQQLNYSKFALIVTNEFPKALRQTFRTMWNNTFGNMTGFKPWDDSSEVRNLFLKAEGGKTRVPTHLSYEEWDFVALIQATILSRSFAMPDSAGQPRKVPHCKFHASVMGPVGYDLESSLHAIHQLRLLRNLFWHPLRVEIDKETFDHYVQQAKEAFIALGIATAQIDAIVSTPLDLPPPVPSEVEDGIRQEILVDAMCLEGFKQKLKKKIEDFQQEHDKRTEDCNEVPPQMSLTVPKMSDVKVSLKNYGDVQFPIDILLLTVEEFEFLSSFANLKNPFVSHDQDVGDVYFGEIGQLRVALVRSHGNTTPVDYALSFQKAIIKMRPKVVFLVGVCGSLDAAKARIGDVLITSKLGTYSPRGMRALESNRSSSLVRFVGEGWMAPLQDPDDREVRIHRGGVLLCVQDRNMSEELIQSYPDAFAIEVRDALATAITDIKVESIAVKGISHYEGASEESEGWKKFASVMAASVVANILEGGTTFEDWPHFNDSFSEIIKTGKKTDGNEARCDDWMSNASSQQVRGKEPRSNFSDQQLNYSKFALIVTNEFPKALRQTFRTMWNNTFGNMTGFKPWDDSSEVRNLFLKAEGGKTRVPTHLSYEEWDFVALIQATILSRSFDRPDSKGQPRKLPHCKFNASVMSPVGYDLESSLSAIHLLRLLRNLFCRSLKAEIDKETFDLFVKLAKEAFIALGIATAQIDAIASTPSDSPPPVPCEVEDGIRQEVLTDVKCLEGFRGNKSGETITIWKQKIDNLQQEHRQASKAYWRNEVDFHSFVTWAKKVLTGYKVDLSSSICS